MGSGFPCDVNYSILFTALLTRFIDLGYQEIFRVISESQLT